MAQSFVCDACGRDYLPKRASQKSTQDGRIKVTINDQEFTVDIRFLFWDSSERYYEPADLCKLCNRQALKLALAQALAL